MMHSMLLPLASLGEHSIAMVGEDKFGSAYFVHGTTVALGDPPQDRIVVDVDLPGKKFDRVRPDFLMTTKGIPLFSRRFIDTVEDLSGGEVDLVPATLRLREGEREFMAGRTVKRLPLIDADASRFLNIRGIRILTDPVFAETSEPFLLARDQEFRRYLIASARLAALIQAAEAAAPGDAVPHEGAIVQARST